MLWVIGGSFIGSIGAAGLKAGAKRLTHENMIHSAITNWRLAAGILAYVALFAFALPM